MSKKKKGGKEKKLSLDSFLGSHADRNESNLPSAPGGLSGAPGGRGGYNSRGGGRHQDGESRSDASSWRSKRSGGGSGDRGGGRRSYNSRDNDRNDDRGYNRREPREDRQESSRYDDNVSRDSLFGTQRQSGGGRSTGGRSNFRDRSDREPRAPRDSQRDSGRELSRENMGKRPTPVRVPMRSSSGYSPSSARSLNRKKVRGKWDGTEKGFGAELVADFFKQEEPATTETRKTYFAGGKGGNVWGPSAGLTDEQQARRDKKTRERDEQRNQEEQERAAKEKEINDRKQAREDEKQRKQDEIDRQKAEESRHEELFSNVKEIISEEEKLMALDRTQIEEIVPSLELDINEAVLLGKALGLSVYSEIIGLNGAINFMPGDNFDDILLNCLSTLVARLGEVDFLRQLTNEGIVVAEVLQDANNFEQKCEDNGLNCLVLKSDMKNKLDEAFAQNPDLIELNTVIRGFNEEIPPSLVESIFGFVFGRYFSNEPKEPIAYFKDCYGLFDYLSCNFGSEENSEKKQVQIIEYLVESWFDHGAENDTLFGVFDAVLRAGGFWPESVNAWNLTGQYTEAKQYALQTDIPNDEDERVLMDWIQTVMEDPEYVEEEEEEYESDDVGGWG